MAGGEGTRLRPITLGLPKPMVPLLGRPVMEHIIGLLKRHGITDICVTLQYMPEVVQSWFGDGAELGVRLTYFVEREPAVPTPHWSSTATRSRWNTAWSLLTIPDGWSGSLKSPAGAKSLPTQ